MEDLGKSLAKSLEDVFPILVEQMGGRLYWGLRRMANDHQEAEDLTQETFIRAYKALGSYDEERIRSLRVEGWLWTIALNLGRNLLRDRSRRPTYVEMVETGQDDPEIVDGHAWDNRLRQLSGNQRIAVVLRHVNGLGIEEISEAVGRPTGTVKADIHRGLLKLRQVMEDES